MSNYVEKLSTNKNGKSYVAFIVNDDSPENPRDFGTLGTIVTVELRSYRLGDEILNRHELKRIEQDKNKIVLPLYLYDHTGISLDTKPFFCPWDSKQIGLIYVDKERVRREYNVKRISSKLTEKVKQALNAEVEIFSEYANGDVFGFFTYEIKEGISPDEIESQYDERLTFVDSCFGFYGYNQAAECCFEAV